MSEIHESRQNANKIIFWMMLPDELPELQVVIGFNSWKLPTNSILKFNKFAKSGYNSIESELYSTFTVEVRNSAVNMLAIDRARVISVVTGHIASRRCNSSSALFLFGEGIAGLLVIV